MMHIDAHQHFWQYDKEAYGWISDEMQVLKRDFLPEDLIPALKSNRVSGCVAVQARQSIAETRFLLDLAKKHKEVLGVVGWIDLQAADPGGQLASFRKYPKLVGFRHIVQDEPDDKFLLRPGFISGVKQILDMGYSYDILIYEKHMGTTLEFLSQFEGGRFVLDHIGKPDMTLGMTESWKSGIEALARFPNLYCKVSGMITEAAWHAWKYDDLAPYLEVVTRAFGPDRLMYGSDWPVCLLAADGYSKVIDIPRRFFEGFSSEEKEKIFGENARQFYQLTYEPGIK